MGFDVNPFATIGRDYGNTSLEEADMADSPLTQFQTWFDEVKATDTLDPTAMVLSTVDDAGHPNSRVVLLKGIDEDAFVFYTNYESTKGQELTKHPYAALNFYWPSLCRQVRVQGRVERVSREASEAYFAKREILSQCSAVISPQSQKIASRDELVAQAKCLFEEHSAKNEQIPCPTYWGGFALKPQQVEFWQGRDFRLHDRISYVKKSSKWEKTRLAP